MELEDLEKSTKSILRGLTDGNDKLIFPTVNEFITKNHKKYFIDPSQDLANIISNIIISLRSAINTKFTCKIVKNSNQNIIETSYGEILKEIEKEHYHSVNNKGKIYTCNFHRESVICHLVSAMIYAIWWNLTKLTKERSINDIETIITYDLTEKYTDWISITKNIRLLALTALLHDVGKPSALTYAEFTRNKDTPKEEHVQYTAFQSHCILGTLIVQRGGYMHESMMLTQDEFDTMCTSISTHMCGYHSVDFSGQTEQEKILRLRILPQQVKNILCDLSVGDHFGAVKDLNQKNDDEEFIISRQTFSSLINETQDPKEYCKKLSISGCVILMRGWSGSGKSTLANIIKQYCENLGHECVIVSKDIIMQETAKDHARNNSMSYSECYAYIEKNKLHGDIRSTIKQTIAENIISNKVIIFDTVACLFSDQIATLIPPQCDVFAIDIKSEELITQEYADRLGIPLQQQINLGGNSTLLNPYDGLPRQSFGLLSSLMTKAQHIVPSQGIIALIRPTYAFQITRTHQRMIGLNHVQEVLQRLLEYHKQTEVERIDTTQMTPVEYINYLLKYGFSKMMEILNIKGFDVTTFQQLRNNEGFTEEQQKIYQKYYNKIFSVKYRESCGEWREKWSRSFRAMWFYINEEGIAIPMKYQLQRGAEVLTGMAINHGIDCTQDLSTPSKIAKLDDHQQHICKILRCSGPDVCKNPKCEHIFGEKSCMTMKVDGILITVTVFKNELIEIISDIIKVGNDFQQMCFEKFKQIGICALVSTQGTMMIGVECQDYFVTSVLTSMKIKTFTEIVELKEKTPTQLFSEFGSPWFDGIKALYESINVNMDMENNLTLSMCFESVCPLRTTGWGITRNELAVSYPNGIYRFLGASKTNTREVLYVPHCYLNVEEKHPFGEPLFWEVEYGRDVNMMMDHLENVMYNRISASKFLELHPYDNKVKYNDAYLDYEGFVLYVGLDYNKIKTPGYYAGHKFNEARIPILYELSKTASHIFPLAKATREFFDGILQKLYPIISHFHKELTAPIGLNKYEHILEQKARNSFNKCSRMDVRCKMLLNSRSSDLTLDVDICNVFSEAFSSIAHILTIEDRKKDICCTLRGILQSLEVWDLSYAVYDPENISQKFKICIENPLSIDEMKKLYSHIMMA